MDALTSFIFVIIAITIHFSLYAIKRLQEPLEPDYFIDINSKKVDKKVKSLAKDKDLKEKKEDNKDKS